MSEQACPELEVLFAELENGRGPALDHARDCAHCSALLEEHRQLEKDLYRLADPLPPSDFVHRVMARLASAPVPVRSELPVGLSILAVSVLLAVGTYLAGAGGVAGAATTTATGLLAVKQYLMTAGHVFGAVWEYAAGPVMFALSAVFLASVLWLRRLASPSAPIEAKVAP